MYMMRSSDCDSSSSSAIYLPHIYYHNNDCMKKLILTAFAISLLLSAGAQNTRQLSLAEAFQLATDHSLQLQMDSLKIDAIGYKKQQTKNAMLPVLGVTSSYTRISNNIEPFSVPFMTQEFVLNPQILNQYNNRFTVQQPVFSGLKNWNGMKSLEQQQLAAGEDMLKSKADVKWTVAQWYYQLYKLQQTALLLDSTIAQTQVRIDDLIRFRNQGIVLNNDVMRAQLQKTNLLVEKANVVSNVEAVNYYLCVMLGLDTQTQLTAAAPAVVQPETDELSLLIGHANTERPEIKSQYFKTAASKYMVKASKAAYMPTVSLVGNGVYNNPNQRIFPQEAKFKATWDVGVSFNWNIMQLYTARAVVAEAKNQYAQIQLGTELLKENIEMEVNANVEALKVARLKIDLAQQAIEQATENRRILNNRFEAQVALLTDVLEADRLLLEARTNLLNAQADAALAQLKLMKSIGEEQE